VSKAQRLQRQQLAAVYFMELYKNTRWLRELGKISVGIHEYCGRNLGIWQRNRLSHPNIAEVVYVQKSHKKMETNLITFFKFSSDLRKSL
jgi:hypothetical protein